jgi:hypothetical protein
LSQRDIQAAASKPSGLVRAGASLIRQLVSCRTVHDVLNGSIGRGRRSEGAAFVGGEVEAPALDIMEIHGAEQIALLLFQKPAGADWRARLSA